MIISTEVVILGENCLRSDFRDKMMKIMEPPRKWLVQCAHPIIIINALFILFFKMYQIMPWLLTSLGANPEWWMRLERETSEGRHNWSWVQWMLNTKDQLELLSDHLRANITFMRNTKEFKNYFSIFPQWNLKTR